MSLLQKNNADFEQFSEDPIVVGLDANMYNSPGHKNSIDSSPGCTTIHSIACIGRIHFGLEMLDLFWHMQEKEE